MEKMLRICFRDPGPEIADAAQCLDAAVSAHLSGRRDIADELIRLADMPGIRDWTESIWGAKSPHVQYRDVPGSLPILRIEERVPVRMPNTAAKQQLHERDGFHCRFCGIPVIRKELRVAIRSELSQFEYGAFMARFQINKAPQNAELCKLLFLIRNLAPRAGQIWALGTCHQIKLAGCRGADREIWRRILIWGGGRQPNPAM